MDRLSPVALALLVAAGCGGGDKAKAPAKAKRSRVDAVVAKAGPKGDDPATFCDQWVDAASAKPFKLPDLAPSSQAPAKGDNWRWVNVWATWCKPCVEELPRLAEWQGKFTKDGVPVELVYLSVDEDDAVVSKFRTDHPGTPETLRIAEADASTDWLVSLGVDENAALPVHLFVDPADRIRCVRMGGVADHHYPSVTRVVKG